jgi:hypothetical protein
MVAPELHGEMQQLFDQADGKVISMDDGPTAQAAQAPAGQNFVPPLAVPDTRATAAEKGSGQVPEPTAKGPDPVNPQGQIGPDGVRKPVLRAEAQAVDANIAANRGTGSLPDGTSEPTLNASTQQGGGKGYLEVDPGKVALRSSQSSNAGVIEPGEARQRRDYAEALDMQAADDSEFYSSIASSERLRLDNQRMAKLNQMAKEDAEYAARQKRIAADAEARIAAAEQSLKDAEVDPNFNPMKEVFEGGDWGRKASMLMGMFAGGMAQGMGHANRFWDQYNLNVDRKIDLMEKRYRARKDYLGAAQDGYSRMRQILQDEQATRAMIEARAWQMFDVEMDRVAQQYNLDTNNAQFMQFKAKIQNTYREKAMESARTTQHVSAVQEQQKDLKIIPLGGGEDKTGSNIDKIVQAREVKKLPIIEGALDNVSTALVSMAKDSSYKDTIAHWLRTGNGLAKDLAPYIAENKEAFTRIAAAANDYVQSKAGSAQTEGEVARLAPVIGKGGADALEATKRFYDILQNEHRAKQADVGAMDGFDEFERRKQERGRGNKKYVPRTDPVGANAK